MVAAVASHPGKVDPETVGWWISLAYALRRAGKRLRRRGSHSASGSLQHGGWCTAVSPSAIPKTQAIHPNVAMIAFTLACYASVAGRMEDAKQTRGMHILRDPACMDLGPDFDRALRAKPAKAS
jgi:hypothetical protein